MRLRLGLLAAGSALALGLAVSGHGRWALALAAGFLVWLARRTRRRLNAHFSGGTVRERGRLLEEEVSGLEAVPGRPWALLTHPGQRVSLLELPSLRTRYHRGFSRPPLAALADSEGRLLWASEDRLHRSSAAGRDETDLAFDAPLLRQSYRLHLNQDQSLAALSTPWLLQAFHPDLSGLRGRVRWEDAGHYFKYAALAPGGASLCLAGALLLDGDEGGGGATEARWGLWRWKDDSWVREWAGAAQSYASTQLRGVSFVAQGRLLLVELHQQGYAFQLLDPSGALRWGRAGEHPVLSREGKRVAFESEAGLHLCDGDGLELWRWPHQERIRAKRVAEDGSVLVLEGLHLRLLDARGQERWHRVWRQDPQWLALAEAPWLAAAAGKRVAALRLPGGTR
ncbi:MAG TPA: hypothetical protein VNZ54_03280 [bacterium]|nr:hypothetical protein [bacterium]